MIADSPKAYPIVGSPPQPLNTERTRQGRNVFPGLNRISATWARYN